MNIKEPSLIDPGIDGRPLIERGASTPWSRVNRTPFGFRHRLAELPLFDAARLGKLATLATERERGPKRELRTLADRISRLEETSDWVKISYANELDPGFARLHQQLLAEFEELTGLPIRETMNWSGMTIFMNSPGFSVPYHFDHETNFLMQVSGTKDVRLFDPTNRAVLTEPEIEAFYRGNPMAGREKENGSEGTRFILNPGDGVHHPPLAPHRIQNLDRKSLSLSIFFTFPEADRRAHVYQVNSMLRTLRFNPQTPGLSARSDQKKIELMRFISKRRPKTQNEMLFSGMRRLTLPARAVRKVAAIVRRRNGS